MKLIDADRVGEMLAPEWMLESLRDGEYSKIVYDDMEYVLLKHGHWIDINEDGSLWECSRCGDRSCCCGNYCMECGAKMDEVTECFG